MHVFGIPDSVYQHRFELFAGFMLLAWAETLARTVVLREKFQPLEAGTQLMSWLVELSIRGLTLPLRALVFIFIAGLIPWKFEPSVLTFVVGYVACDFVYYWKHRWMHETPWLWALHAPHHTSVRLNLLTGVRLGWLQRQVDDFFFLPLVLLGLDPGFLLFLILLNEIYPLWCHSELIGRLGVIDQVLNTPHNHRMHHSSDVAQSSSHYGSTFMCWDRWFGTARDTGSPAAFGIEGVAPSLNPLRQQFQVLLQGLSRTAQLDPRRSSKETNIP